MVYNDYFSGLLSISKDYYEAATVDGATKWQQFMNVTLPSLGNILFLFNHPNCRQLENV